VVLCLYVFGRAFLYNGGAIQAVRIFMGLLSFCGPELVGIWLLCLKEGNRMSELGGCIRVGCR